MKDILNDLEIKEYKRSDLKGFCKCWKLFFSISRSLRVAMGVLGCYNGEGALLVIHSWIKVNALELNSLGKKIKHVSLLFSSKFCKMIFLVFFSLYA